MLKKYKNKDSYSTDCLSYVQLNITSVIAANSKENL